MSTSVANPVHITGFEHGGLFAALNKIYRSTGGTVTIQSTTKRTGTYALRVQPATGVATFLEANFEGASVGDPFGRVYIRFGTLPNANVMLFSLRQGAGTRVYAGFSWNNSTSKIRPFLYDAGTTTYYYGTDHSQAISTGTWYRIDYKIIQTGGTAYTIDFEVEGVAGTQLSQTGLSIATTFSRAVYGDMVSGAPTTGDIYFDDSCVYDTGIGTTWPAYPVGEGGVEIILPTADGTHSTAASFTDNAANSPPASVYDRLDEIPITDGTAEDYIYQDTIGASDYLEVTTTNPTGSYEYANGAVVRASYHGGSVAAAVMKWTVRDGVNATDTTTLNESTALATSRVWKMGTYSAYLGLKENGLTKAVIEGLLFRIGYSSDVTPFINTHHMHMEVDYAATGGGSDHWAWAEQDLDSWQVV